MESLRENKSLVYTLVMSFCLVIALSLGISSSFSESFDIVVFDVEVRIKWLIHHNTLLICLHHLQWYAIARAELMDTFFFLSFISVSIYFAGNVDSEFLMRFYFG